MNFCRFYSTSRGLVFWIFFWGEGFGFFWGGGGDSDVEVCGYVDMNFDMMHEGCGDVVFSLSLSQSTSSMSINRSFFRAKHSKNINLIRTVGCDFLFEF